MEYATLICCGIIVVLLIVLLVRSAGAGDDKRISELEKQIALLRESSDGGNRQLLDQVSRQSEATVTTVVKSMADLGRVLNEGQERQQKSANERLTALEEEFIRIRQDMLSALEKVREGNAQALEKMRAENQASMDKINQTVNEKLQKTLNDRITQSFEMVNRRLSEVYEGLGEMKAVASGVADLKNVLSKVKNRGTLGEIQLEALLEDILAPEQYEKQFRMNPRRKLMVDFAVKLPGQQEGEYVYLPIDSKFPGDTWANLAAAYDSGNSEKIQQGRAVLESVIKKCADDIRKKYIDPPYSTDFAILFLPFEGLYAEVVNIRGLVETLQREYKVNIAGPSTMAAMLNSLQMGFRTLAIQKKSGEVWKILEDAKREFTTFETVLTKARNRLRQADEDLEALIGTRTNKINSALKSVSVLDMTGGSAQLPELPS